MDIKNQTVFVSGASRGLGLAFAREAVARGARKVYAGVRDVAGFSEPGITAVALDVTRPDSIATAAAALGDVTVLVNNAGIARLHQSALDGDIVEISKELMETNYYGIVRLTQAFAPTLAANGGGAIINVLSDATWFSIPLLTAYASTKSAAWSYTNALRQSIKQQQTHVLALHVGFLDTDMTKGFDMPKTAPALVAQRSYDALAQGLDEVLADDGTKAIKASLGQAQSFYLNPPAL